MPKFFKNIFGATRAPTLFAWENGGGLGHINRLQPVARALQERGFKIAFAIRTPEGAEAIAREFQRASIIQAPFFGLGAKSPPVTKGGFRGFAANYADVLLRNGYDCVENLRPLVLQWRLILERIKPAAIVCDFSPSVVLAAAGRFPVIHLGSGFASPPVGKPLLLLHPPSKSGAKQREAQVLGAIQRVQSSFGAPVPSQVSDILGFSESFVCCLTELDPYRSVKDRATIGPISPLGTPQEFPKKHSLFGYLDGRDSNVARLLKCVAAVGITAEIFIRWPTPGCEDAVRGSSVKLHFEAQNLREALTSASAILHHGGLGTTESALAIGRPQFLFPKHLEQMLTADAVHISGCGINLIGKNFDPGEAIKNAMEKQSYSHAVTTVAAKVAARRSRAASEIADICALLADRT